MKVRQDKKQLLQHNERHIIPMQTQRNTKGHQMHLDISEHKDPNTTILIQFEASLDSGRTWLDAGAYTLRGGHHEIDKNGNLVIYTVTAWGTNSDPIEHKLMRGWVTILSTDPLSWDNHQMRVPASLFDPGTPARLSGTYNEQDELDLNTAERTVLVNIPHPAPGIAKIFSARPSTPVNTRVHLIGTKHGLDKSLIPAD